MSSLATIAEVRAAARGPVLLRGELVWSQAAFTADCTIRDKSATGARIRLVSEQAIPHRVYLIERRMDGAYEALVAWKNLPDVGLQFVQEHALGEDCSPALTYLRRLWIERRAR